MLTADQKEYVRRHHLVRLTFEGYNDLYQTWRGAHTVADIMALDQTPQQRKTKSEPIADTYSAAEDRFIDEHGCGTGLW